jgi:hypothetical protein
MSQGNYGSMTPVSLLLPFSAGDKLENFAIVKEAEFMLCRIS